MEIYNMPMSFGLALAQQPKASRRFTSMTDKEKDRTIQQASQLKSKREMWAFVTKLAQG